MFTLSGTIVCLLFSAASAAQQWRIFRYIDLTPQDTIWLGEPFRATNLADRVNDSTFQLKPGTFGGAERVRIIVGPGGVTRMEFQYDSGTRFRSTLADYVAALGLPSGTDSTSRRILKFWQDGRTRFELRS